MADSKISALTSASTPLAGTEVLPIVQSGATVKVAVSDLTAGRAISATQVTMSTGNLIPGTAAKGVNFTANTPVAGMTSQLLNWYEEGTWTPVVAGGTTPGTYELIASSKGIYTRVGRVVTWAIDIRLAAAITGGGTGSLTITGLPFTVSNTTGVPGPSILYHFNIAFTASATTVMTPTAGATTLSVLSMTQAGGQTVESISAAVVNGYLRSTGQYIV